MRGTLGIGIGIGIGIGRKLPNPSYICNAAAKQTLIPFSTYSGSGRGGGGRGRGRGGSPPTGPIGFIQQESDDSPPDSSVSPVPSGLGHGHGKPIPSSPVRPSFSSPIQPPSAAAGRGRGLSEPSAAGRGQGLSEPSAAGRGRGLSEPSADGRGQGLSEPSAAGRGRGLSEPSADGRGRGFIEPSAAGRGRGLSEPSAAGRGQGLSETSAAGRGRGLSEPSTDGRCQGLNEPSAAGRGRGLSEPRAAGPHPPQVQDTGPMRPNFFTREERSDTAPSKPNIGISDSGVSILPESLRASFGSGRGKPMKQPVPETEIQQEQENRHVRAAQDRSTRAPKMSREEAVQHAVRVLTQGGDDGVASGRGMRGRGRGRWEGGGRGRGRRGDRRKGDKFGDSADRGGLYLGDNADGEKLARKLGPQIMNKLAEGFEEMSDYVLPSPIDEAYLDALGWNLSIELEPEFHMGELQMNPDIDEKPPIPLRDALEKMKPFLMAYEGIQSHEEWEEIMKETMEKVPQLKEIVDFYSGEDRVTAMEQQRELERVVKTVPASAPVSVMGFTERAAHILQSNPGWKFGQKCEFMDRLVAQVSQQYK